MDETGSRIDCAVIGAGGVGQAVARALTRQARTIEPAPSCSAALVAQQSFFAAICR